MIALLKKDKAWLGTFFLLGAGVALVVLLDRPVDLLFTGGAWRNTEELFTAWWIFAGVLGFYAALRDRVFGTREYLLHRPVSPERVFWVRSLGCALVMAAVAAVPYLLLWFSPFDDDNRAVWEFRHVATMLALSTSMWSLFAVGTYAATVPASRLGAVLQTGLVGVPVAYVAWRTMFPLGDAWSVSPWFYIGVQAAMSGALLLLSALHFVRGQDPDRDVAPGLKTANAVLVSIGAVLLASIPLSELQRERYKALIGAYPLIQERAEGFVRIRRTYEDDEYRDEVLDENHQPTDVVGPTDWALPTWNKSDFPRWPDFERQLESEYERHGPALGGVRRQVAHVGGVVDHNAWFDVARGVVEAYGLYYRPHGEFHPPWRRTFARPDGRGLSPTTQFRQHGRLFALDPADHTVWALQLRKDSAGFERLELPDGDRPQRLKTLPWQDDSADPPRRRYRMGVVGERGTYEWDSTGDRFVEASPEHTVRRVSRADPRRRVAASHKLVMSVRGDDPLSFDVAAADREGTVRFETTFEPRTGSERTAALLVPVATVFRSPVLALASLGFEPPGLWPFDPLLTYGGRLWLLGLNLVFAAALVFFTRRRLRRFGANAASLRLWTVLVALGGLAVYVVFLFVERKRAHAAVTLLASEDVPPLLIRSA